MKIITSKIKFTETSKQGKNFNNEPLTEDNLNSGKNVIWHDHVFITGNRKNTEVELYQNGKFIRTVSMKQIYLLRLLKNN